MNASFTPVNPVDPGAGAIAAGLAVLVILCIGLVLDIRLLRRMNRDGIPEPLYAERLLQRHWHWMDALWLGLVMAVFVSAAALIANILDRFAGDFAPSTVRVVVILQNLLTQGLALGLVFHLQRRSGTTLADSLGGPPARLRTRFRQAFLFYVAALPFIAGTALISNALCAMTGIEMEPQPVLGGFIDTTAPVWFKGWLVLTAIATAPLVEEVVFRGVFFPALARHRGIPAAVVMVSMIFAFIHGHPPAILPLFAVGVTLALSYLYTGSLLVPILIHSIFNTVNLTALMLSGITYTP